MNGQKIGEAVERIKQMEVCFDVLRKAAEKSPEEACKSAWFNGLLQILTAYYEGGEWLRDYELDEAGLIPKEVKRGVLSQDGVYNFLQEISETVAKLK